MQRDLKIKVSGIAILETSLVIPLILTFILFAIQISLIIATKQSLLLYLDESIKALSLPENINNDAKLDMLLNDVQTHILQLKYNITKDDYLISARCKVNKSIYDTSAGNNAFFTEKFNADLYEILKSNILFEIDLETSNILEKCGIKIIFDLRKLLLVEFLGNFEELSTISIGKSFTLRKII